MCFISLVLKKGPTDACSVVFPLESGPAGTRVGANRVRAYLVDIPTDVRVLCAFVHIVVAVQTRPSRQTDTSEGGVTARSSASTATRLGTV